MKYLIITTLMSYLLTMTFWTDSLMKRVFDKDLNVFLDFLIVVVGNAFILPVNIILEIIY